MGRQIQILMNKQDEDSMLAYLHSNYDIVLILPFSPKTDSLFQHKFSPLNEGNSSYFIWNKEFLWQPVFEQTKDHTRYYAKNINGAPIIDFSRSHLDYIGKDVNLSRFWGRLYWQKNFVVSDLQYDSTKFEAFYNDLTRWIKRHSPMTIKTAGLSIHILADTWREVQQRGLEREIVALDVFTLMANST